MRGKDIKELVVVKLEEFSPYGTDGSSEGGPLLSGSNALDEIKPIYSYVEESLPSAADEMLLIIPLNKLYSTTYTAGVPVADEDRPTTGYVITPIDYLRLHTFKMEGWKKAVHYAANIGDSVANQQDYDASMGHPYKPVVVWDDDRLRYYSIEEDATHNILDFKYIAMFSEYSNYPENVAEIIAINCAKKVYEIFGNTEGVKLMASELQSALELMKV